MAEHLTSQERARANALRFVWRTLWRKARKAARYKGRHFFRLSPSLQAVHDLGGYGPPAVRALVAREAGDGAWPRLDLVLYRAWRAHLVAGGSVAWGSWRAGNIERSRALQAIALAARKGARGHDLIECGAAVLRAWAETVRR